MRIYSRCVFIAHKVCTFFLAVILGVLLIIGVDNGYAADDGALTVASEFKGKQSEAADNGWAAQFPLNHEPTPVDHGYDVKDYFLGFVLIVFLVSLLAKNKFNRTPKKSHALSRFFGGVFNVNKNKSIALLESRWLTARHSVHVLRWEGVDFLVGCNDHSFVVLSEKKVSHE